MLTASGLLAKDPFARLICLGNEFVRRRKLQ